MKINLLHSKGDKLLVYRGFCWVKWKVTEYEIQNDERNNEKSVQEAVLWFSSVVEILEQKRDVDSEV